MAQYLILAQSKCTAAALNAWLELLGEERLTLDAPQMILWEKQSPDCGQGVQDYERLVRAIETATQVAGSSAPLNDTVALVDYVRPEDMSAISENETWSHIIALLVLTFPEIRWMFGVLGGNLREFPTLEHDLKNLSNGYSKSPLLDPTGLRDWVRRKTNNALMKSELGFSLPTRLKRAAAMDEEQGYAYIHGYTAYRYGYRTELVYSWKHMELLFGKNAPLEHGFDLLLEDMSLNFPDRPLNLHLLDLENERANENCCPRLSLDERSDHRILVTTGQDNRNGKVIERNKAFLAKKTYGRGKVVFKPAGGMIDLWRKSSLLKWGKRGQRKGNVNGFDWPPSTPQNFSGENTEQRPGGHGAPGKLMLVADTLISRAERLREDSCSVQDLIRGAIYATDAAELLGARTPTSTLAALALKHEYEARAESAFVGLGYHFDVKERITEIELETHAVSKWFKRSKQRISVCNAAVVIMNRLSLVFRDSGQFEEEQDILVALRRHHRRLQFISRKGPINWALNAILWYAEFLLSSFDKLVLAIMLWIAVLTAGWYTLDATASGFSGFLATLAAFFGGDVAHDGEPAALALWSGVAVVSGYFHLGILISYLYMLISRK